MFSGSYEHSLDAKGRIIIPAQFREKLGDAFYISKGLDHNLCVYPSDEWESFVEQLSKLPSLDARARSLQRFMVSGAVKVLPDKQGRVLIPTNLRDYANLDKDCLFVGDIKKVEIWNKSQFESDMDDIDPVALANDLGQQYDLSGFTF